jgi:urea transport system ATP-binding protein
MSENKILNIQNVTVSFDGFKVLDDLNFSINYGEIRFLIGPNGAGKTTLLDVITGKVKSYKGRVIFDTKFNAARISEHGLVHKGIARKFQTPSVFPTLTVYENVEAASGFRARYDQLLRPLPRPEKDKILHTLELIGLIPKAAYPSSQLSHGEKQWLEIGMLLVQDPKLLLLDEPVAGMSRAERDRTGELLSQIGENRSILVIEHDMVFVRQFASTVTVLHQGKVLTEAPMTEIQNNPQVKEIYLGRSHEKTA